MEQSTPTDSGLKPIDGLSKCPAWQANQKAILRQAVREKALKVLEIITKTCSQTTNGYIIPNNVLQVVEETLKENEKINNIEDPI